MDFIKLIKNWLCLKCCCEDKKVVDVHTTVDDASFVVLENQEPEVSNLRIYSDDVNCASWFNVPADEPGKRTPLTHINKGDAVVFYDKWKDQLNKGLFIVTSFDYGNGDMPGSAPRALYGRMFLEIP